MREPGRSRRPMLNGSFLKSDTFRDVIGYQTFGATFG